MKKIFLILGICMSCLSICVLSEARKVVCDSEQPISTGGSGGGEYNDKTCPGKQGHRHCQVVVCTKVTLWGNGSSEFRAGCMAGDEDCYDMNPCDGGNWTPYAGSSVVCKYDPSNN